MSVDTIGDFLTVIRNGVAVNKPFVVAPHSKLKFAIAYLLKSEGFIRDIEVVDQEHGKREIKVYLKYVNGESVIHEITRLSKPGCRAYEGKGSIKPVVGGLGVSVLTTSKGVLTHKQAEQLGVGGEVICTVW
jgi:small subunit ribosomal protein S8